MRVALVSPYSWMVPSGVNAHVTSLAGHLERQGHDVWIIAPGGILTHAVKTLPHNFIVAGRSIPVRTNGSIARANAWPLMMQKMARIFARYRFDLVHVHEPTIPSVGASAAMVATVPVVGTFHAAGGASSYYRRWRPLAARILASVTVCIAVSEAARSCVAEHFPAEYRVIPNGIDLDFYAGARKGPTVRGRILFVGRPEPRKGLGTLVEAFRELRKRLPWTSLVLVGPTLQELHALKLGPPLASPEAFAGIEALGRLSEEEKLEQMQRAEILCAPSLGGESFGIVLAEALAAGLPVVASDIPGYRAVLADGSVGVLVPPGDCFALEKALFSVLEDCELQQHLSQVGPDQVERYSWDWVVVQVLEAYEEAVRLGPRLVGERPVPILKQMWQFVQQRSVDSRVHVEAKCGQLPVRGALTEPTGTGLGPRSDR